MLDNIIVIITFIIINVIISFFKDAEMIRLIVGVNYLINLLIKLGFSEKLNVDLSKLNFNINYFCINCTIVYSIFKLYHI